MRMMIMIMVMIVIIIMILMIIMIIIMIIIKIIIIIIMIIKIGARERRRIAFFPKEFFNICFLSQYIMYWINFSDIFILLHVKNITS